MIIEPIIFHTNENGIKQARFAGTKLTDVNVTIGKKYFEKGLLATVIWKVFSIIDREQADFNEKAKYIYKTKIKQK